VAGRVTAVGDSVMLDYQGALQYEIPGVAVYAAVSRQWGDGEALLQELKAQGALGAEVIVGLGTNGPITDTDFDTMMSILGGASRVVFVNVHVDRPWQDPNNAVIANGMTRYPNVVVADWATLAAQNPAWFGSDGTHLGIDGPGAVALASLITTTLADK
jgi:lysophospholipase L1-like esterase